ncbi:hypothetical protein N7519_009294 [Penicillium mononematosum]|uniref:uncharacterized protein n=1 Tax=Penicillium mononematosum TaxID=268346 RepID=UPI0025488B95|nr:uncharacterized protein N7519_009294 [Penicillium mononematosum]KAJ6178833.1 hypothetical protein N7519_009294 [Penicillium mononematosum]
MARKPVARFPLTTKLYPLISKQRGKNKPRTQYVSEGLIDNVLERVSPYLRRNQPLDILDLWPGGGLMSSKVNELLQPRRHVLVEPDPRFNNFLQPLAQSNPCYKLVDEPIYGKFDWSYFFATHLPEQGRGNRECSAIIPKNDSLLILANLPAAKSGMDHFKPSRWFLNYMKSCLKQKDVNLYGAVRVLATMPSSEVSDMLPRSTGERTRTGVFAETIGLHNIEIASPAEEERSHQWRGWDDLNKIRERVAERAAANNIITPPTREFPPLEVVPHIPYRTSRVERPYQPRVLSQMHKKQLMDIAAADKLGLDSCTDTADPKVKAIIRKRSLAWSKLARDNSASYFRQQLADVILEQDQVGWTFARAAADPKESVESLKALEDRMVSLKSSYATLKSSIHHTMLEKHQHTIDDARLGRLANHFVDAGLTHDQRPFEPLYIHPDETYPREDGRAVIYFEPDSNPPVLKKTLDLPGAMVQLVLDRYFSMLAVVGTRGTMPVAEFLKTLFPAESINSHVRDIPSLASFAERRLKPGRGPMPLPEGSTSDPAFTYQDNVDYDLSGVRLRISSAATLLDVAIKYEKLPEKLDIISFSRALGGTMTQAQLGEELLNKRLR